MQEDELVTYHAAGGVVVDAAGRVLLLERTVDGRHEIRLAKGHVEPGETDQEAALREVCEETGYCQVTILADLGVWSVNFRHPDGYRVERQEHYFLMTLAGDRTRPPQFSSAREALFRNRWAESYGAAQDLLTFDAERDAVARAQHTHANLPLDDRQ